jgi:hypothetical protein
VIAISAKTGATRDIAESLAMHDPGGAIVVGVEENGPAAKARPEKRGRDLLGRRRADQGRERTDQEDPRNSARLDRAHCAATGPRRGPASRPVKFSSANPR